MNTHFSVHSHQNQTFKILEFSCLEEDSSHLILEHHHLISSSKYVSLGNRLTAKHSLALGLKYNLLFSSMLIPLFVTTD
jgi:hypothetical protein